MILNPEDMWCLILTNAQYPIPEDYLPVLKEVPGQGQSVDERIYDPLMEMLSDMKEQGLSLLSVPVTGLLISRKCCLTGRFPPM